MKPPANSSDESRKAVWSRYWDSAALHSCGTSFSVNYAGDLADFWVDMFGTLAPNARILDVCTGNGALPMLLAESKLGTDLECDAIDMASIEPAWVQTLAPESRRRIRFHRETLVESLPFAAESFDLIISQYGIEYTDLPTAIPELLRVLRKDGKLAFVVHHLEATPVRVARLEIPHLEWLLAANGYFEVAMQMIRPMSLAGSAAGKLALRNDASAQATRRAFDSLRNEQQRRAASSSCPDVLQDATNWVAEGLGLAATGNTDAAREWIAKRRRDLSDSLVRLRELVDCAMSDQDIDQLAQSLGQSGRHCRRLPLRHQDHLMGWSIVAEPTPA